MPPYTYRDYVDHLFDDSDRVQRIAQQLVRNCDESLNITSEFLKNRFTGASGIAKNLTYGKVENIKEVIQEGILGGFRFYLCVANLNNIVIPYRPNQDAVALYNSFTTDKQIREKLLARYDVLPAMNRYADVLFDGVLDLNPDFLNYPYKEVNLIRVYIRFAVENAYLMCLVICE